MLFPEAVLLSMVEGWDAVHHQIFRFPFAPHCMDYSFSSGLMYLHLAEV